jgi:putative ATP-binding cassette transporter
MALISLINFSSNEVVENKSVNLQFCIFILLLFIFLFGTTRATKSTIASAQGLVHKYKMRILSSVLKSKLSSIDSIGRPEIHQVVVRDVQMISQSISILVSAGQCLATVIFLVFYMAFISVTAFTITAIASVGFVVFGVFISKKIATGFREAWEKESVSNEIFSDFLSGYQEIKMDSRRARDIAHELIAISNDTSQQKEKSLILATQYFNYLQVLMYLVVGLLIYIVPLISPEISTNVMQATTTALFITASLAGLIQAGPNLSQSNMSAKSIIALQKKLADTNTDFETSNKHDEKFSDVKSVTLDNIRYMHEKEKLDNNFELGPLSYTFEMGKVYFIRGRNGSGKTTLVRILTGLYTPQSGQVLVNDLPIKQPVSGAYRNLFSVVFSDFYLFKKTYGLSDIADSEFRTLFEMFEIEDKISINEGLFSTTKLSSGQRKRLALIVALLERKPILILDEWAADQDPEFRKEFYEVIIPRIRAMGKLVIAITHDDHYYASADEVLHVVNGKLIGGTEAL